MNHFERRHGSHSSSSVFLSISLSHTTMTKQRTKQGRCNKLIDTYVFGSSHSTSNTALSPTRPPSTPDPRHSAYTCCAPLAADDGGGENWVVDEGSTATDVSARLVCFLRRFRKFAFWIGRPLRVTLMSYIPNVCI